MKKTRVFYSVCTLLVIMTAMGCSNGKKLKKIRNADSAKTSRGAITQDVSIVYVDDISISYAVEGATVREQSDTAQLSYEHANGSLSVTISASGANGKEQEDYTLDDVHTLRQSLHLGVQWEVTEEGLYTNGTWQMAGFVAASTSNPGHIEAYCFIYGTQEYTITFIRTGTHEFNREIGMIRDFILPG